MNKGELVAFVLALLLSISGSGQDLVQPLNLDYSIQFYSKNSKSDTVYHSFSKPFLSSRIQNADTVGWARKHHKNWFTRKLRNEHLVQIEKGDLYLTLDPLFNFQFGRDTEDTSNTNLTTNTRGFLLQGAIGKKLSFYSSFYENQSFLPNYLSSQVDESGVVPGQGRTKPFKQTGYDYNMASAVLNFAPTPWLNIQAGHGKNKVGDGYRSLLLSDNSFNYPFLKTTASFWKNKIQYQLLYASLQHLQRLPATTSSEAQFVRKAGTFHNLSFSPHQMVELSVFEGVVYKNWDSTGTQTLPWNFYMPVLGLNTAVEGMSGDNAKPIFGANIRVHPFKGYMFYSQLAFDDYRGSNTAFQFGLSAFDALTIKNLFLQFEWNTVSNGMYQHNNSQISYEHYAGQLAHPMGNDFNELVARVNYSLHDFFVSAKLIYADRRGEQSIDQGNGTVVIMPTDEKITYQDYAIGYLLNPNTNMKLKLGVATRNLKHVLATDKTNWFYISFITDLQTVYYDF